MARTVNEKEYAIRRNAILDMTQRLVYTKGYEQMAIQDILNELQMSKGAFYHYFDSKPALLEALIERMQQEAEQLLLPIVQDPHLDALEKFQRYIDAGVRWKTARKAFLIELLRVWYSDHNAIVRQKMWATMTKRAMPLLLEIIYQGIREGVLNIPYPDQVGTIVLSLIYGLGDAFAELLLSSHPQGDELQRAKRLVAAYTDALERVLGAPAGSLTLMDAAALQEWFAVQSDHAEIDALPASAGAQAA
ncbi:MAG TPA: TetR/AcrR family transcriptional regulator [Roseiflexaceae bacterium]|nr:TetR/AcrR family transcriptional regulator [Roseiflexaceae bacterium]